MNTKNWKYSVIAMLFICLFSVSAAGNTRAPSIEWERWYGGTGTDTASSIQQTEDGGYIVAGSSRSTNGDVTENHGSYDFWVVKLNPEGDIVWQKSHGGSGAERASSIQQTTCGGYIVGGTSNFDGNKGWVVKLDKHGEIEWIYNDSRTSSINDIRETREGGYIFTGSLSGDSDLSGSRGMGNCWVVKLDSKGAIVWQKLMGGSKHDSGMSVRQTNDGGFIVAAVADSSDGDILKNRGEADFWIIKLDTVGEVVWQKTFGGSKSDIARSIQQTADDGYVVAGYSYSNDGDVPSNQGSADYWIVNLDVEGNLLWTRSFGGTGMDWANSIYQTKDGGYVIAGQSDSKDGDVSGNHGSFDFWIVKLNTEGDLVWEKSLGGSDTDRAYSIQQTSDGGYIIAGDTYSQNSGILRSWFSRSWYREDIDFWVVKLKPEAY